MGKPGYVKLTTFGDVRRFLAQIINERNNDTISSTKFKDLVYGCNVLNRVMESEYLQKEIETRLARIEQDSVPLSRCSVDVESERNLN